MELQGQKLAETSVQNVLLVTLFFGQPGAKVRHACREVFLRWFCHAIRSKGLNVWCTSMEAMPLWIDTCDRRSYKRMQKTELSTQRVQQEKGCDTLTQVITNSSTLPASPSSWIWSRLGWPLSFEWRDHVHLGLKTLSKLASRGRMSSLAIQSTLLDTWGDDPMWRAYDSDGLVQPPTSTLLGTNISPKNGILKMIFLFPRWDMLIPWRVHEKDCYLADSPTFPVTFGVRRKALPDLIKRSQQGRAGASIQRKAKDLLMIY